MKKFNFVEPIYVDDLCKDNGTYGFIATMKYYNDALKFRRGINKMLKRNEKFKGLGGRASMRKGVLNGEQVFRVVWTVNKKFWKEA